MSDLITHATIWKNRLMWNSPNSTVIYWMYLQLWVPENLTPPAFNGTGRGNQYLELSRVFILPRDTKLTPKFKLILNSLQKHTLAHSLSYLHTHTHYQACCFISYICSVTESGSNPRLVLPTFPLCPMHCNLPFRVVLLREKLRWQLCFCHLRPHTHGHSHNRRQHYHSTNMFALGFACLQFLPKLLIRSLSLHSECNFKL